MMMERSRYARHILRGISGCSDEVIWKCVRRLEHENKTIDSTCILNDLGFYYFDNSYCKLIFSASRFIT